MKQYLTLLRVRHSYFLICSILLYVIKISYCASLWVMIQLENNAL